MRELTTAALCAKEIRKELKQKYPGINFKVTSKNYTNGNSVTIDYVDSKISDSIIKADLRKYAEGSVNIMEDMYEYDNINKDIPQTKYIFVCREISESLKNEALAYLKEVRGDFDKLEFWEIEHKIELYIDNVYPNL